MLEYLEHATTSKITTASASTSERKRDIQRRLRLKGEEAPEQPLAKGSKVHSRLGHTTFLSPGSGLPPAAKQSPPEQTGGMGNEITQPCHPGQTALPWAAGSSPHPARLGISMPMGHVGFGASAQQHQLPALRAGSRGSRTAGLLSAPLMAVSQTRPTSHTSPQRRQEPT